MRKIPFSPPDITEAEIDAVCGALHSGWITTGPKTKLFEQKIAMRCGTERAACLSSCTAGLECILRILGIGEGDEVIVPAYTYTASASCVYHVGAKIVLCDVKKGSFFPSTEQITEKISEKTKAVICVDIGGRMCDYNEIRKALEAKKALFHPENELQKSFGRVIIIADAAHSYGASRAAVKSGNAADFSSFSFHAVKNLTTAEGGAVTWKSRDFIDNDDMYRRFMLQSLHGQNKDALAKTKASGWEYDITAPLYKCNMTDIQAAIGLVQDERYDDILAKRREFIGIYDKILCDTRFSHLVHYYDDVVSSGHLYLLNIGGISYNQRGEIIEKMSERGVATNVHYKPLPKLTAYKNLGFDIADFPNAYEQFVNEITLPLNTKMTADDVVYTAENLINILKDY